MARGVLALGVPGLILGVVVLLTVREPVRGQMDGVEVEGAKNEQRASIPESLRFLWRQKAAFHSIMGAGVCALCGLGPGSGGTPTFLMRTYNLDVGEAGRRNRTYSPRGRRDRESGNGVVAGTSIHGRPPPRLLGVDRRRCVRNDSFVHRLLDALTPARQGDVLDTHSRDLFLHRPVLALVQNLAPRHMRSVFAAWSGLCGNVFNLIIAPQLVGS